MNQKPPFKVAGSLGSFGVADVSAPPQLDMTRIGPADRAIIERMAERAARLGKLWHGMAHGALRDGAPMDAQRFRDRTFELNPTVLAMDLCVVHLLRGLDLPAFEAADDLTFQAEIAIVQSHVNRRLCSFPFGVRLRFARTGER